MINLQYVTFNISISFEVMSEPCILNSEVPSDVTDILAILDESSVSPFLTKIEGNTSSPKNKVQEWVCC